MKIPYLASEWRVLLRPYRFGRYVNDHTLFRDDRGDWHLIGITSRKGKPNFERYFTHAVTPSLQKPMKEVAKVIDTGTLAWAPGVVRHGDCFYMYYGPSPAKLAVSRDAVEWFGHDVKFDAPPMTCHRDHFALKIKENEWIMYVSGVKDGKSCVSYLRSDNLLDWKYGGSALASGENAPLNPPWGAMESPFVFQKDGIYYLFVTYTDCSKKTYENTLVFASASPCDFGIYRENAEPVAVLKTHAPEIVTDADGKTYITACGWKRSSPHRGKVMIAELAFR